MEVMYLNNVIYTKIALPLYTKSLTLLPRVSRFFHLGFFLVYEYHSDHMDDTDIKNCSFMDL